MQEDQAAPVVATLEDRDLWMKFHQVGTEMIITKAGRRMFPPCKIRVSGLVSQAKYLFMVDFVPVDNFRYKWTKGGWEACGGADPPAPPAPPRPFLHPESPASGGRWMRDGASFRALKLTNSSSSSPAPHGHVVLHSMRRYRPRFHVVRAEGGPPGVAGGHGGHGGRGGPTFRMTFSFPETEFTAVTAYQNHQVTRLKIDHNPFAKGFRDHGRARRRDRKKGGDPDSRPSGTPRGREETPGDPKRFPGPPEDPPDDPWAPPRGPFFGGAPPPRGFLGGLTPEFGVIPPPDPPPFPLFPYGCW